MDLSLKYFLPIATPKSVKEVFHYDGKETGNSLSCFMTISSSVDSDDLPNLSKFVWNGVLDEFMHYEGSVLEGLKKSLKVGVAKVRELLRHNQELVESGVNFEITLVSLVEGSLYIALLGEHDVVIFRENEKISIAQLFRDHKVSAGSAAIYPTDVIMVTQNDEGITWEDPATLLHDLESGQNQEGLLLLSQEIDFDNYLNGKGPEPVLEVPEGEMDAIPEDEVKAGNEPSPYLKGLDEDEEKGDMSEEPTEPSPEVLEKRKERLEKLGKAGEVIEKATPAVKKSYGVTKDILSKGFNLLTIIVDKLGVLISKIIEFVLNMADGRFGRQPWFKRLRAKMTQTRIGGGSLGKVRLGDYTQRQKRSKRMALMIVVIAAIVLGAWGIKQTREAKEARERHDQYVQYIAIVDGYLQDAKDSVRSDKDSAEIALFNANEEYGTLPYEKELLSPEDLVDYESIKDEILKVEDQLFSREVIREGDGMEVLVDAKLSFGSKSSPTDIAIKKDNLLNENLYVTDSGEAALFVVTTSGSVSRVNDPDGLFQSPMYVDVGVAGAYVYDSVVGAVRASYEGESAGLEGLSLLSGVGVDDFGVSDPAEFAIFTNTDNTYLLSRDQEAVIKAQGTGGNSYALPYTYLAEETIGSGEDIFGDFSIYILSSGSGGLGSYYYDYTEGRIVKSNTQITGLRESFEDLTAGYTGESLANHLYVYDRAGKRILIFEKPDAQNNIHPDSFLFLRELVYRGDSETVLSDVKDLVVDAAEENIYLLDGSKIWRIPL